MIVPEFSFIQWFQLELDIEVEKFQNKYKIFSITWFWGCLWFDRGMMHPSTLVQWPSSGGAIESAAIISIEWRRGVAPNQTGSKALAHASAEAVKAPRFGAFSRVSRTGTGASPRASARQLSRVSLRTFVTDFDFSLSTPAGIFPLCFGVRRHSRTILI